jgi:hypothetical protein
LIISCLLFIDINTTLLYQAAIKQATVMIAAVACHSAETTIEEIPQRLGLDDAKSGGWIIDRLRACAPASWLVGSHLTRTQSLWFLLETKSLNKQCIL